MGTQVRGYTIRLFRDINLFPTPTHKLSIQEHFFSAAKNPVSVLLWANKVLNTLQDRIASEQGQTIKTGLGLKKLESAPQMDLWLLSLQFTTKSAILCLVFACSLWFYHMYMYL